MTAKNKANKNFTNKIDKRKVFVFALALLISAFLWFINNMKTDTNVSVSIKYKLVNLTSNYINRDSCSEKLNFNLLGSGADLLKQKYFLPQRSLLNFDINKANLKFHTDSSVMYFVVKEYINSHYKNLFNDNVKINSITPDTIFLYNVSNLTSKKLPIKLDIKYKIPDEYLLNKIEFLEENFVIVYGSQKILDNMTFVKTKTRDLGTIDNSEPISLELERISDIKYSVTNIKIKFQIEKFTEKSIKLKVVKRNFPEMSNSEIIPETVTVYFKTPLSLFDKIDENNFDVFVDYEKRKTENRIFIEAVSKNKVIEITSIFPLHVKYILEINKND